MCRFFNQICENKSEISNLPKILNFVKIIHYYSKLFTRVLRSAALHVRGGNGRRGGPSLDPTVEHVVDGDVQLPVGTSGREDDRLGFMSSFPTKS